MGDARVGSDERARTGRRAVASAVAARGLLGVLGGVLLLTACTGDGPAQRDPQAATPTAAATRSSGSSGSSATTDDGADDADAPCTVTYSVGNAWPDGFGARVEVTNDGPSREDWVLAWEFDAGQEITESWEAQVEQDGARVTAAAPTWAPTLAPGARASFGFNASWSGENPDPTRFTLDGDPCTVVVVSGEYVDDDTTDDTADDTTDDTADDTTDDTGGGAGEAVGGLYVGDGTQALTAWAAATGTDKELLAAIAHTPQATWLGSWTDAAGARDQAARVTGAAADAGSTAVLVVYAVPGRDCGLHSAGGVAAGEYVRWVETVADGVEGHPIVVLEPDALAQLGDCDGQGDRVGYLAAAARALDAAGARVYLDAGHSGWHPAAETARRIERVGTEHLAGFALNTSNYQTTADERAYGEQVAGLLDGLGFVVDTSRNGNGSNGEWCNPRGRALGDPPRLVDDGTALDALLWVKAPGESDGACNGGPAAGRWWQEMALELARNARP
ncbi:glycoside hydrolase family 6 protein [Cellulomonas sp. DKR-3]|uniref:Glucanase n=1 Tax=Cellulomonas fulva TaxID=2835530 RepID=A0ABS5TY93_9CELL|nr:glycoside hydrolase family 6 protein [Cellulomonas fulva]MBT0994062.1 glycoside hydrolase family 6 protein [Cellulomonas fulva]